MCCQGELISGVICYFKHCTASARAGLPGVVYFSAHSRGPNIMNIKVFQRPIHQLNRGSFHIMEPPPPDMSSAAQAPGQPTAGLAIQQAYRLKQICRLQRQLEGERDARHALYNKYRRCDSALDSISTTLITTSIGLGIGGIGLLSTVVAAPIVLGLEVGSVVCGVLATTGKHFGRQLSAKARKHSKIRVLADSKLDSIAPHIYAAVGRNGISDREFQLVIEEVKRFTVLTEHIHLNTKNSKIPASGRPTRRQE